MVLVAKHEFVEMVRAFRWSLKQWPAWGGEFRGARAGAATEPLPEPLPMEGRERCRREPCSV